MVNLKHKKHHHCVKHKHKYLSILRVIKRNKTLFATLKCSSLTNVQLLVALEEICSRFNSVAIEESSRIVKPDDFNIFKVLGKCWVVLERIPDQIADSTGGNGGFLLPNKQLKATGVNENLRYERVVLRAPRLKCLNQNETNRDTKPDRLCDSNLPEKTNTLKKENGKLKPSVLLEPQVIDSAIEMLPTFCDTTETVSTKDTRKKLPLQLTSNIGLTINCNDCITNKEICKTKKCRIILNRIPVHKVAASFKKCLVILNRIPANLLSSDVEVESFKDKKTKPKELALRECSVVLHRLDETAILNASKHNDIMAPSELSEISLPIPNIPLNKNNPNVDFEYNSCHEIRSNGLCETENSSFSCSFCNYKTIFKYYFERHVCCATEEKAITRDLHVYKSVQKFPLKNRLLNY